MAISLEKMSIKEAIDAVIAIREFDEIDPCTDEATEQAEAWMKKRWSYKHREIKE